MHTWPPKDPDEVLDYQFDWSSRLDVGETISVSTFVLESGSVTLGNEALAGGLTTVWISDGDVGSVAVVTNRITTSSGRTYDESARLRIRSK